MARRFADQSLGSFVDALASSEPVPGGGSAAAATAAIAAGLVAMVASLSDRPRYAEHAALHAGVGAAAREAAAEALALADEDAAAYAEFAAALKRPRESDADRAERAGAIDAAARLAADVPRRTVALCARIAEGAEALAGRSNVNASSDLVVAALLAEAAARSAALNVSVNLPSVQDESWVQRTSRETSDLVERTASLATSARRTVEAGEARGPVAAAPSSTA